MMMLMGQKLKIDCLSFKQNCFFHCFTWVYIYVFNMFYYEVGYNYNNYNCN